MCAHNMRHWNRYHRLAVCWTIHMYTIQSNIINFDLSFLCSFIFWKRTVGTCTSIIWNSCFTARRIIPYSSSKRPALSAPPIVNVFPELYNKNNVLLIAITVIFYTKYTTYNNIITHSLSKIIFFICQW